MLWILMLTLLVLLTLTLFLIAPASTRSRADTWRETPFAHRGLHDKEIAENSLEAFERACEHGFGIELDVQLSRDGELVVFHDMDLKRLTGDPRPVDQVDLAELQRLSLKDSASHIPTFAEALKCVNGRVPLLVELKNGRRNLELCEKAMQMLQKYCGAYVVESFNPFMLRWLKKNTPEVLRGQLVGSLPCYRMFGRLLPSLILCTLSLNFLSRPDFVAYEVNAQRFTAPRIQRRLFHTPLAAWTVKDPETYEAALSRGEMPIFEGFVPEKN